MFFLGSKQSLQDLISALSSCIIFVFFSALLLITPYKAKADTVTDVATVLASITCESAYLVEMGFSGKFGNTCTPIALSSIAIANILSPGIFATTLAHTKISDQNINVLQNNCARSNRAASVNPKLTFSMCSNVLLAGLKSIAIAKVVGNSAAALVSGDNILDAVQSAWQIDPNDYHVAFLNKGVGESGVFLDLAIPMPWKVTQNNDKICVSTYGLFGLMPVGCKYIKEPCSVAKYDNLMSGDSSSTANNDDTKFLPASTKDCSGAGSCFARANEISKTLNPMSGPLVYCIREMLVKVLISDNVCSFEDFNNNPNAALGASTSTFFQFQKNMQKAVSAFLILYTIFFGMNILLNVGGEMPGKGEIVMFPIKIILVLYFSVGINMKTGSTSRGFDGMTQWVLPIVFDGANQLASWVMNAGTTMGQATAATATTSGSLCKFNVGDYSNSEDARMILWDALDCRISSYLGINALSDTISKLSNPFSFDSLSFSIPPWMYFLGPAIYTGNMSLIMLVLMYPIMVISVAAYTVNAFVVCMIGITILSVLAPIFIPMVLFEYTKSYFDAWVKLLISFVLQPMVVATFMILMFSVYDSGIYTGCTYKVVWQNDSNGRSKKTFTIDNDKASYQTIAAFADGTTSTAYEQCQKSLGWMLNSPLLAAANLTGNAAVNATSAVSDVVSGKSNILSGIGEVSGMFLRGPLGLVDPMLIKDLTLSFMTACFLLYVMYNLSSQISGFAADMTEGISVGSLAIQPQTIAKAALFVADKANAIKGAVSKGAGDASSGGGNRPSPMALGNQSGSNTPPPPMATSKPSSPSIPPPSAEDISPPPPTATGGSGGGSSTPPPSAEDDSSASPVPPPSAEDDSPVAPPSATGSSDRDSSVPPPSAEDDSPVPPPAAEGPNESDKGK